MLFNQCIIDGMFVGFIHLKQVNKIFPKAIIMQNDVNTTIILTILWYDWHFLPWILLILLMYSNWSIDCSYKTIQWVEWYWCRDANTFFVLSLYLTVNFFIKLTVLICFYCNVSNTVVQSSLTFPIWRATFATK